jgi:hypothetical protein
VKMNIRNINDFGVIQYEYPDVLASLPLGFCRYLTTLLTTNVTASKKIDDLKIIMTCSKE